MSKADSLQVACPEAAAERLCAVCNAGPWDPREHATKNDHDALIIIIHNDMEI